MIVACPICHGSSSFWRAVGQLPIYRCDTCSHHFHPIADEALHTAKVYSDDYFVGSSEGYQDYVAEEPLQRRSAQYYAKQIQRFATNPGRALDIGAACGFFSDQFQQAGWNCIGIEPNRRMREIATSRFRVEMFDSLESFSESTSSGNALPFQLATLIQVISHLPNPRLTLKQVNQQLQETGLLLVETWDRNSLIAKLSGSGWHEWNPPSVIHWFTRASLRKLLDEEGFDTIAQGLPRKQIQIGRAFRMLRHSWNHSLIARLATAPLRMVPEKLALPYLLGDAFWLLARKRKR